MNCLQNNYIPTIKNSLCNLYATTSSIVTDRENTINRVVRASLPYFNFYSPLAKYITPVGQVILVGTSAKNSYTHLKTLVQEYKEGTSNKTSYIHAALGLAELTTAVISIPFYRVGMTVSTSIEIVTNVNKTRCQLQQRQFRKAAKTTFKVANSSLRLASLLYPSLELVVASTASQIILEIAKSHKEWKKGRYIETVSNIGLAVLRSYFVVPQIKLLHKKWCKKPTRTFETRINNSQNPNSDPTIQRRAAIDVGSGGTKVLIADVDVRTNEIVKVIFENSFSVPYQASLELSSDNSFDSTIRDKGIHTFKEIKDILDLHSVDAVSAIATAAFRQAANGADFAKDIQTQTGIPLKIIAQQQEGVIAYNSALAVNKTESKRMIVWDIGTGSFQITSKGENEQYNVFTGGMGSVPFKNHIIENIQGKDPEYVYTPNPISDKEYKEIGRFARGLGRQASKELKLELKSKETTIVGIGRLFFNSVLPVTKLEDDSTLITRKGLRSFIRASLEKPDQNPYHSVDVPNCIQVLEVMKSLHIKEIKVVETTTTKGMLVSAFDSFSSWLK